MIELQRETATALARLRRKHRKPSVLATGVDPDFHSFDLGLGYDAILEADDERGAPVDNGTSLVQQLASSRWIARLERLVMLVQYKNKRLALTCLLPERVARGYGPDRR